MMPPGDSGNKLADEFANALVVDAARAVGIDVHAHRLRNADGVGQLHFAAIGQAGGDDVLGHVPGHVGGAAIDLGRILAAEGAAAVTAPAAVGIDDDLAAGQPAVAVRTADHEPAGRIDVIGDLAVDQLLRQQRLDDVLDDEVADFLLLHVRASCCVETTTVSMRTGLSPSYSMVTWLLLSGRSQSTSPLLAGLGQAIEDPVRQGDRQRHQLGRVVAGVAEHQALVAGADFLALGLIFVDALRDVGALAVIRATSTAQVSAADAPSRRPV